MRAFLQSLDEKVWQAVEIGWTKPKEALTDWDEAKIKAVRFNSRALNALFSAVTNEEEDKSFNEFYAKLKDIVNSVFNLGKTIPEPKIVRKVLRSLPKRFHAKITAIEKSKDIDKIPLIELVGNLQTYELELTRIGKSGKSKSMALKAKSSDMDEFSDNENSKMKSYITR